MSPLLSLLSPESFMALAVFLYPCFILMLLFIVLGTVKHCQDTVVLLLYSLL
jgi:hypothetical protein